MLKWGLNHVAENHGFCADTKDLETEGVVCIWSAEKTLNVPTLSDTQMLCDDLGINAKESIDISDCGLDIYPTHDWFNTKGKETFKGMELWRRKH